MPAKLTDIIIPRLLITIRSYYTLKKITAGNAYKMRKNVLIFSHGYKDGFIEATNQYTQLFDETHYDVTVVYLDGESDEQVRKKHLADQVLFLNTTSQQKCGLKLPLIKKMLRLQQLKNFEIVICHRYKPTYIMLWVNKFCRIKALICVMHDMETFKSLPRKYLLSCLAKNNILIGGVSNAVRDDLASSLLGSMKQRVITLYNTVNIKTTEAALLSPINARKQLNLSEDSFIFGILGRLVPVKNHKTLIEAFAIIKPDCPNAKLIIIGDGELKATLQHQITQLGLTHDICLTGFLPNAFSLLTAFDVFVLSSIQEAFGRVLLEAMIAKCPIIATKTNGVPEVMGNIGMLIEKENPQQLAGAMLTFYNMSIEERKKHAALSYERVINTFSIDTFKRSFWALPLFTEAPITEAHTSS